MLKEYTDLGSTTDFSNQDLSGSYQLFCLDLIGLNLHHSNWLDGNLNDFQVPDPSPIRAQIAFDYGNRGRNQPTARISCRSIGMPSY